MTDNVIPAYHRRSSQGEVFVNSLNSTSYTDEVRTSQFTAEDRGKGSGYHYKYYRSGRPDDSLVVPSLNATVDLDTSFLSIDSTPAQSSALLEAYSNVSVAAAGILETIAERHETLATIRRLVTGRVFSDLASYRRRIAKLLSRRRVGASLKTALDSGSSEWLGYRYGIRPIVFDIQNLLTALTVVRPIRNTARALRILTNQEETTIDTSMSIAGGTYPLVLPIRQKYTKFVTKSVRPGILFEIEESAANNLALRLGAQSILGTAWELVPYSFVVDWFINVGNYIAAWSPSLGTRKLGSWMMTTETSSQILTAYPLATTYNNWCCSGGVFFRKRTRVRKVRTPDPSVPTLPVFETRLDMSKWVDLVALFMQLRA